MPDTQCSTCTFWVKVNAGEGECHRFPPQVVAIGSFGAANAVSRWPSPDLILIVESTSAMPDTPLPEDELKRVEEYCEKATAARHLKSMMEAVYSLPKFDRDFIFAARTDLPALVAEVRRLRADLEQAAKLIEQRTGKPHWPAWDTLANDWLKRVREREGKNG